MDLDGTISLDDYLRLYLGDYVTGEPRHPLEKAVSEVLRSTEHIDEVLTSVIPAAQPALEVDLLVRCGNQIGVAEVKMKGAKAGIDQLTAVAEQRFLGTYVAKFLISGRALHDHNARLAREYNITVIEFQNFIEGQFLEDSDRIRLTGAVLSRLRRR